MTESLRALLAETEVNNTFDIQSVSSTLKMTIENSFGYLYRLQRNMVKFKEFYFPQSVSSDTSALSAGDMYLDEKHRVCFNIDVDLVKQIARDRFYTSNLYKQEFTLEDIEQRKDIFERSILVMVDRSYYFDIKLKMLNGAVQVILPYKMSFLYRNNNTVVEHKTSVVVFDNISFMHFQTNRGILNRYMEDMNYMILPEMVGLKKFRDDGMYMMSIHTDADAGSSLLYPCFLQKSGNLMVDFNSHMKELITNTSTDITCYLTFFVDMYELTSRTGSAIMAQNISGMDDPSTNIVMIDRSDMKLYNMPVPTENMFVWKRISDGTEYNGDYEPFYQSGMNLFYPNMYTVKDPTMEVGDDYRIFYFYKKGYDLHYENKFYYFYDYLKQKLNVPLLEIAVNRVFTKNMSGLSASDADAISGTFRKLMNYKWLEIEFSTQDFLKVNPPVSSYEYRVNRLKEFIADDSGVLTNYVKHQNTTGDTYYLYTKGMDLEKRRRSDTSLEMTTTIKFDTDCYVFLFQNTEGSNYLNLRVWVDGLLVRGLIHEMEYGVDFIYVPVNQVTDDSYIEIDVLHDANFTGTFYLQDMYASSDFVIPSDLITPTKNDLIFIGESANGTITEYTADDFEISRSRKGLDLSLTNNFGWVYSLKNVNAVDKLEGLAKEDPSITTMMDSLNLVPADEEVVVDTGENRYSTMDLIRIKAKDEKVLHQTIRLKIRKNPYFREFHYERTGYPIIDLKEYAFKFNPDYVRIYKNGRLMPNTMYLVKTNFDRLRLQMLFEVDPGDDLVLDISSLCNEMIYHIEELPDDGIIDLTGKIDKPFDIRLYDVFLNGKKLNERNVFRVTDTKIQLKNIDSIYHLDIYQRDRDEEYFGWTKNSTSYYYRVEDLLAESFITKSDQEWILADIIKHQIDAADKTDLIKFRENTNTENRNCADDIAFDESLRHKIFYYEEVVPLRLGNPNEVQFNKEYIESEYPEDAAVWGLEDTEYGLPENDLELSRFPHSALYFDPDIHAETATDVYMLGDYDDICKKLLEKGE